MKTANKYIDIPIEPMALHQYDSNGKYISDHLRYIVGEFITKKEALSFLKTININHKGKVVKSRRFDNSCSTEGATRSIGFPYKNGNNKIDFFKAIRNYDNCYGKWDFIRVRLTETWISVEFITNRKDTFDIRNYTGLFDDIRGTIWRENTQTGKLEVIEKRLKDHYSYSSYVITKNLPKALKDIRPNHFGCFSDVVDVTTKQYHLNKKDKKEAVKISKRCGCFLSSIGCSVDPNCNIGKALNITPIEYTVYNCLKDYLIEDYLESYPTVRFWVLDNLTQYKDFLQDRSIAREISFESLENK